MIAELISWLVAFVVLAVTEAFTFQLVSIWFALGSVVAFVAALCGAPLWLQITLFVAASLILLAATRPLAKKLLKKKPVPTNVDTMIGKHGVVLTEIDNLNGTGRIAVDGLDWSAKGVDETLIPKGTEVEILEIQGVKAVVKPVAEKA
ncbi:MAG: NfeD family protein [Oscillospiraceae bacterium]